MLGVDQLELVVSRSDYLVVCLALTDETRNIINSTVLKSAKKGMVLFNIGRGQLIDEDALVEALRNDTLRGAALDVFATEPLPKTSPIWALPNVLISPHNADLTVDSRYKSVRLFTENCARFVARDDLQCIVDKSAGY